MIKNLKFKIKNYTNIILNLLFPPRCLSCGKHGFYLCPPCVVSLYNITTQTICPVCKKSAIDGVTHPKCKKRISLDGLAVFWNYRGIARKIIHKIKYDPFIFSAIDEIISCHINLPKNPIFQDFLNQKPILVPVPLHCSRFRYRGYNHAEKIAQAFGKKWNLKVFPDLLIRTRKTTPQVKLKGEERKKNIHNAFSLNYNSKFLILNSRLILVDDVWTTGSTLTECCRVLKQNSTRSVWALTLAR